MPYDSEGNFTRKYNWDEDRQNNIDIASDRMDGEFDNYAGGMNLAFLRDGRAPMTGALKMSNFQVKQVADGTLPTDAVNKKQIDAIKTSGKNEIVSILNALHQIGDIKASVRNANHGNWFLCNGQAVNRVKYSALFGIIGTKFGAGDGATTFNLPDYRGKFLRGLGGNSASDVYKTQAESLPNIKAEFFPMRYNNNKTVSGAFYNLSTTTTGKGSDSHDLTNVGTGFEAGRSNAIYNGSHVTPINQAVNYFIKVAEEK